MHDILNSFKKESDVTVIDMAMRIAHCDEIQALACDVDGTLIENEGRADLYSQTGVDTIRAFGVLEENETTPINLDWWASYRGRGHRFLHQTLLEAGKVMRHPDGTPVSADEFTKACVQRYLTELEKKSPSEKGQMARPGTQEIVKAFLAAGKPIIAVSGNEHHVVNANLKAVGVHNIMQHVISNCTIKEMGYNPKPAPDGYIYGAGLLGVDPSKMLVLEDSGTGTKAAADAGALAVRIMYAGDVPSNDARWTVGDRENLTTALYRKMKAEGFLTPKVSSMPAARPAMSAYK